MDALLVISIQGAETAVSAYRMGDVCDLVTPTRTQESLVGNRVTGAKRVPPHPDKISMHQDGAYYKTGSLFYLLRKKVWQS